MNQPTTPFAQKIKELLKEKGATQQELAEACSLTPGSISCWMAGAVPNAQLIIPIARFFGITVEELLAPLSPDPVAAAEKSQVSSITSPSAPTVEIQITEFEPAEEVFTSQFGTLTFRAWCAREAERLQPLGITCIIQSKGSDLIALFRVL